MRVLPPTRENLTVVWFDGERLCYRFFSSSKDAASFSRSLPGAVLISSADVLPVGDVVAQ